MRRLVREHRLADHVADGEDRRLVRAPLLVDHDEAALIDLHLRAVETGNSRVWAAPDGDEHAVEHLIGPGAALTRGARLLKRDTDALRLRRHLDHARLEQN